MQRGRSRVVVIGASLAGLFAAAAAAEQADGGYADYDTNTILKGEAAALREVIDGDLFKAEATVEGARSYDTQIGGSTTVPELTVTKIAVTGHAN